ncbi:MAG: branched-chain amino acid ABC transporter permease [Casimicrobiaceae bacterium]
MPDAGSVVATVRHSEQTSDHTLTSFAVAFIALGMLFAAIAAWRHDVFFFRLATEALIFGGLALSVDVLLGYTGMLSLGQALFFGLGAYVSALVMKNLMASFWLAMGVTLAVATVVGFVAAVISIRARGIYFALITFGLAQVVAKVVFNTPRLGASDGIIGIPVIKIDLFAFRVDAADAGAFFLFCLTFVMALYFLCAYLARTPAGRTLAAIRANEDRVPFLGYPVGLIKVLAFVLAADIAAISGALYPMLRGFVSPELLYFEVSGNAVITVIIGGVGTLIGPLYGSVVIVGLKSMIGSYTAHHLIAIGTLFVLSVIFFPQGLIGYLKTRIERRIATRRVRTQQ